VPFPASADMAVWLQKLKFYSLSSEMFGEPLSSQKSTDLTSPHANEILLEFVLNGVKHGLNEILSNYNTNKKGRINLS
jgi:hypothetical protein